MTKIEGPPLTDRQIEILRMLFEMSEQASVFTTRKRQIDLAKRLGLTRQALNIHLRKLRDAGLIRTGRGFIDLTEDALRVLGLETAEAFVFLKINPPKRESVYEKIRALPALDVYRVTGEIDLVAIVPQAQLDRFLGEVSGIDGVISTSSHVVISSIKRPWKNL
ncbi:MAG: Lrp/AsnC family transcriptional regulator [Candidatus Methanosuratincola sp.]|uniref:Transcriptional regulator, AsnC family n=1 Tax=Methanosuratincola subterraneus TaxID=2593994 RepID=A0A3S3RM48_METS7|nr:Lrp/AsnC family transcriptional regulator [Candidatus Methanosuratincola sp.]RWX72858.1 MAG: Transcriptional regulator, AsnC family [Candidatus Methanosuratincola subterraneus]